MTCSGRIPISICLIDANINIDNNQLCPIYPECIDGNQGLQEMSNCAEYKLVCDTGYIEILGSCYYESDIIIIQAFIDSLVTILDLSSDDNQDGIIHPLELGDQEWEGGRIEKFSVIIYQSNPNPNGIPENIGKAADRDSTDCACAIFLSSTASFMVVLFSSAYFIANSRFISSVDNRTPIVKTPIILNRMKKIF